MRQAPIPHAATMSAKAPNAPHGVCAHAVLKSKRRMFWRGLVLLPDIRKNVLQNHLWAPPIGGGIATIASAATTDIWANVAASVTISGTTGVTALANADAVPGTIKVVTASGIFTMTNSASLVLPSGANITTAVGDPSAAVSLPDDDNVLIELEERIFECYRATRAYNDEIDRVARIVQNEYRRLYRDLDAAELNRAIREMPENKEQTRLVGLQKPHFEEMDKLIEKMWATPARTPEGRRAKVSVLLGCTMANDWRETDKNADWDILQTRRLLIEFVGGEPAEQLRDQFSDDLLAAS
jgi:hypothetical protein